MLLKGCPGCEGSAPPFATMHAEGWLIVADAEGITFVACAEHRGEYAHLSPVIAPSRPAEVPASADQWFGSSGRKEPERVREPEHVAGSEVRFPVLRSATAF